ncbi:preprotein translocase subunit SecA [Candidatus Xenohaliotis californiensis]|uniref:preprotein translocase subunit SecA n=1 Tax=Candidatus Xenohaliotis californiensis TaxID=84677 RepID=UPI0030C82442
MIRLAKKILKKTPNVEIKNLQKTVHNINAMEAKLEMLSNDQLYNKTSEFRELLSKGMTIDDILESAFAVVREVSKRKMNMRHFDVQIIGGIVLHSGTIAEMKTGEGKTLVATLSAYLNALTGNGVHVVTVNDYLTKRDSDWMSTIYNALGMSVGCVLSNMAPDVRKHAYNADITYGTNNEFGFDYLRDNMCLEKNMLVQRPFNYAIIDEVDSILIDEARTPLIISDMVDNDISAYPKINKIIKKLDSSNYTIDEKDRSVFLTDSGIAKIEKNLYEANIIKANTELYSVDNFDTVHLINQSLKAHSLFECNKDYIVKNGKIIIIDEFTGRMMDGRRYSDGLHQAIEAKEGVQVLKESQTLASITFQNYFRMYPKISGMTATAVTEEDELKNIYNLSVVSIPTNVPVKRFDHNDVVYKTEIEKYDAILELIKECHAKKQPVLVGTVSIEKSEYLSKILKKTKLTHQVLNAKYHEKEANIIAQAGCPSAITIATNMAGRGTDIKLGGNVDMAFAEYIKKDFQNLESQDEIYNKEKEKFYEKFQKQKNKVLEAGGLFVIGTERHESRRIDNQLRGRSGRQGDIGASKFFISLEDDLMRIFGSDKIGGLLTKIGLKHGEAIQHPWINKTMQKAQKKIEMRNYEIRKNIMKFDDIINEQRRVVFKQRIQLMNASDDDILESFEAIREQVNEAMINKLAGSAKYPEDWDTNSFDAHFNMLYGFRIDINPWIMEDNSSNAKILKQINEITMAHFAKKIQIYGKKNAATIQKRIWLVVIGKSWAENLANLDSLRSGIHLRAMGNKDPFIEYSKEAFEAFNACLAKIDESCIMGFSRVDVEDGIKDIANQNTTPPVLLVSRKKHNPVESNPLKPSTWGVVSRNAACPCKSGKKYKNCHGSPKKS